MKEYGSRLHRILEILSWIILGLSFLVAVYGMFTLPDVIATHYNVRGEVDDYGSPATLFMTPVCMGICLLIVSLCMHFVNPRNWNTVTEVRRRNRKAVYRDLLTMMVLTELEVSVFTFYLQILFSLETVKGLWIGMLIFCGLIALTVILLSVKMYKDNKKGYV